MKKKFKFITTISCICLALAVMVAGVYAASSTTYELTNSITYEIDEAMAKIDTKVYASTSDTVATTASGLAGLGYSDTAIQSLSVQSYDENNVPTDLARTSDELTMNFNDAYAYKVVVTVSTISNNGVFVAVQAPALASGANLLVDASAVTKPSTVNCTKTGALIYTYYVGLKDPTNAIGTNKTDLFTANCKVSVTLS